MATNGNPRSAWVQGTLRALRFSFRVVREALIHAGYAYWMMPPDYFSARNAHRAKSEGWDADQIARSDRWRLEPDETDRGRNVE